MIQQFFSQKGFKILEIDGFADLIIERPRRGGTEKICVELKWINEKLRPGKSKFQTALGQLLFCKSFFKDARDFWLIINRMPRHKKDKHYKDTMSVFKEIFSLYKIKIFYFNSKQNKLYRIFRPPHIFKRLSNVDRQNMRDSMEKIKEVLEHRKKNQTGQEAPARS